MRRDEESRKQRFDTTSWDLVYGAAGSNDSHDPAARDKFCGRYWYPIYAFIRRQGHDEHAAKDLTQGFFYEFIMRKDLLSTADREKGRLRDYLMIAIRRYLHDQWDRAKSAKRGGDVKITSFDATAAEERYLREPKDDLSPDRCYDRAWAMSVLAEIMRVLDQTYARLGGEHQVWYLALRPLLDATKASSDNVEKVAVALGAAPSQVADRKFRLRKEWRATAIAVVKQTLHKATDEDAIAELRLLVEFLQGGRQAGRGTK